MFIILCVLLFLIGSVIGSFLNVVIDRVPEKKSLIYPPSHCSECQHKLGVLDLIPVVSYIVLKGRCRYCKTKIPVRILLVELFTGLFYVLILWSFKRFGLSFELAAAVIYTSLFIALSVIDLERGILPHRLTIPFMILAVFVFTILGPGLGDINLFNLWISNQYVANFLSLISGAIAGYLFLLVPSLIYQKARGAEGMGGGDLMLALLIGLVTGLPTVFISIVISALLGGLVAVILLLARIKRSKEGIPFGPFLCLGAMIALLWGPQIIYWYLGSG